MGRQCACGKHPVDYRSQIQHGQQEVMPENIPSPLEFMQTVERRFNKLDAQIGELTQMVHYLLHPTGTDGVPKHPGQPYE